MDQEVKEVEIAELVEQAIARHGERRDAVIPILSEINRVLGYIPAVALSEIRRRIHAPADGVFLADSHLYSAASFYQLFSLKPLGRHVIRFCESAPCHVVGGRQVIEALQNELGLAIGNTSEDNKWSLLTTSCLGVCSVGPVLLIDDDIYGNVAADQVPAILARYE